MRVLSLGYSPCPNDTFIFYGLVHRKIDTGNLRFREVLLDVETLNRKARGAELDITKVSFHAFGHLRDTYCLLRSGGALGKGCGPLIVAREPYSVDELRGRTIAIPGSLTTAFLLLQLCDMELGRKVREMPFHQIIQAVRNGEVDAGLIIHESRFTFEQAGLRRVLDLGEWWELETGLPVPLGGIIAKRALGRDIVTSSDTFIRKSVEFALANRSKTKEYVREHARELDDEVIERHISLYVNDYSLDIGDDGAGAAAELFRRSEALGIMKSQPLPLFL